MPIDEVTGFTISPQQRRVFSVDPGGAVVPFVAEASLTLEGVLDEKQMEQAWASVVSRHEIFRTQFVAHPGLKTLLQVIQPERAVPIDWSTRAEAPGNGDHTCRTNAFSDVDFDLSAGQVLRCILVQCSSGNNRMILTAPAVCADAKTMENLARELVAAYSGAALPQSLESPVLQYADVAEHFNDVLRSEKGALGRQYWHPRVTALKAPSINSTTPSLPVAQIFRPRSVDGRLGKNLLGHASQSLGPEQVSDELLLLTCWRALLQQLSGESVFAIGYAADGRDPAELQSCMGLFERYLPLKISGTADTTFRESLKADRDTVKEALRWQKSFSWPEPESFHAVCFSYYDANWKLDLPDLKVRCSGLNVCSDRFELKLSCVVSESDVLIDLWYDSALFPEREARQMLSQFITLVEHASAAVDTPIKCLNCVSVEEKNLLLSEYSLGATQTVVADLVSRIEKLAGESPDSSAVEYGREKLAYGELNRRANQLAHYLRGCRVGLETPVAVCLERGFDMIVALLAILKSGGAYVPLDPELPSERLAYMVNDARIHLVLTQENLRARLPQNDIHQECLPGVWENAASLSDANPGLNARDENLAYVIYTSGSTGRPKGVAVTRGGLNNYIYWACGAYQCRSSMRVPLYSSLAFDLSITALWPPLVSGGCVVLAPEREGIEWLAGKTQMRYDLVKTTPAQLRMLEQLLPEDRDGVTDRFVIGGEALRWEELDCWCRQTDVRLVNEYGPTETVVGSCSYEVSSWQADGKVPIGRAIANTQLYVLNERGDLSPLGALGELLIGGAGVARGYLNRPDLTAEHFVPDPFSEVPGRRLYRTGDLVRWRADSHLEYLGRLDHQVKLRGYRIEPGEIEASLEQHPAVSQAVVVLREDQSGEVRLVGYVVKNDAGPLDTSTLRRHLEEHLPEYMIPVTLVQLEEMPLTLNGKIDRKALPEPVEEKPVGQGPKTVVEELIASIWEEVLNRSGITRNASFFDLGGHSLLATQVVSRIRNIFGVDLALRVIFEAPTVTALAEEIEKRQGAASKAQVAPIQRADRNCELPLSYAQERLWFLDQLQPGNVAYNVPFGLKLHGELNRNALRQSLAEMVRRHEVLRSSFPTRDGVPVQRIVAELNFQVEEADLRHLTQEQRRPEVYRLITETVEQPFDLSTGPLLRARILQTGDQDHLVLVTVHHIVSDGWSVGIMTRELGALYGGYSAGKNPQLPELPIQYADYAFWQREWLRGEVLEEQIGYWKKQLACLQVLELPPDRHVPTGVATRSGGFTLFELDPELTEKVKEAARREGVTLFMLLLAAFKVVLSVYAERDDIAIGTDIANRNREEIEGLIGFFVNQLVLRTDLSGPITFAELLKRVRQVTFEAYQHQDAPFTKVVEELTSLRNADTNPLFGVKFVFQNTPAEDMTLTGLQLEIIELEQKTAKFDLMLTVSLKDTVLVGAIEYRKDLFIQSTVRLLQSLFRQVLLDIVIEPAIELSDLKQRLKDSQASHRAAQQAEAKRASARDLLSVKRREPSRT
ncbi:MAG TPA: amino acid adenylation domain-containing protein [Candidatus Angelobacter sp.]